MSISSHDDPHAGRHSVREFNIIGIVFVVVLSAIIAGFGSIAAVKVLGLPERFANGAMLILAVACVKVAFGMRNCRIMRWATREPPAR
jgi:hypothetical protein